MNGWRGRHDALEGPEGVRWHEIVVDDAEEGFVILGFCSDEGVNRNRGRIGASEGPHTLRHALSNLPAWPGLTLADAGDVELVEGDLEGGQKVFGDRVCRLLSQSRKVIGVGGGHEIARGSYLGLVHSTPVGEGDRIGLLNLDAHFDMRLGAIASSGNSILFAAEHAARFGINLDIKVWGISEASNTQSLFSRAAEHKVKWKLDSELDSDSVHELTGWIEGLDHLYVTLCLDVFPGSLAPGVSAPAAIGVDPRVISSLLRAAAGSGKLRLFDVAELCPRLDRDDQTARLAARMIWDTARAWVI